jgi:methylglutaconyl-CoA hydratase
VGRQRALQMILTGRPVSSVEAESWGLVDRVVVTGVDNPEKANAQVLDEARQLAVEILRGGPVAVGQALRAVRGWEDGGVSEAEGYEVVLGTEDRLAALKAFREKGVAKYKGF